MCHRGLTASTGSFQRTLLSKSSGHLLGCRSWLVAFRHARERGVSSKSCSITIAAASPNGNGPSGSFSSPQDLLASMGRSSLGPVGSDALSPWNQLRVMDSYFGRRLNLDNDTMEQLGGLRGTTSVEELQYRATILGEWKHSLRRGILPKVRADQVWPHPMIAQELLSILDRVEMPRFLRRYSQLVDPVLSRVMSIVSDFEEKLAEAEQSTPPPEAGAGGEEESPEQGQGEQSGASGEGGGPPQDDQEKQGEQDNMEALEKMIQDLANQASSQDSSQSDSQGEGQGQDGEGGPDLEASLQSSPPGGPGQGERDTEASLQEQQRKEQERAEREEQRQREMEQKLREEMVQSLKEVEQEWKTSAGNFEAAEDLLGDLDGLMKAGGADMSRALWRKVGWHQLKKLSRQLEAMPELRELVRSLGRSGGTGPKRRAPQQVEARGAPAGVVRSPLVPDETSGLTRSGDLARMLPVELSLRAAGWPRPLETPGGLQEQEGLLGARLLHHARRAEKALISYERSGWQSDIPSRYTGKFEFRPAAEQGPIIVCLDTSGSMSGSPETIAKAVTLECMRSAHVQGRPCYLYSFSGPGDVKGLELNPDPASMENLLDFLTYSFGGGTDVDTPLELSLTRLEELPEWSQADILMVSDGQIYGLREDIQLRLDKAAEERGLQVHGLQIGYQGRSQTEEEVTGPFKDLCTHFHVFNSWHAVQQ